MRANHGIGQAGVPLRDFRIVDVALAHGYPQGRRRSPWRPGFMHLGAMATAAQRDIVGRHVDEAVARGAQATTGGKPTGTGTFFEPTVLADVDQSMLSLIHI